MSDEAPLDLRVLADVDSPEIVRAALRRFRRRALTRYIWVGVGVAVFVAAVLWGRTPTTLAERVDRASSKAFPETVWRVRGVSVALEMAADLGDTVGLHLVVLPDDPSSPPRIAVSGQVASMGFGAWDEYLEVAAGSVPTLTIRVNGNELRVPLDERAGIPDVFWR